MMVRDEDSCNILFCVVRYKNFCGQKKHKKLLLWFKKNRTKGLVANNEKEQKNKTLNKHASLCEIGLKKKFSSTEEEEEEEEER